MVSVRRCQPPEQVNIARRYNSWQDKTNLTLTYIKLDMKPIGMNLWTIRDLQKGQLKIHDSQILKEHDKSCNVKRTMEEPTIFLHTKMNTSKQGIGYESHPK